MFTIPGGIDAKRVDAGGAINQAPARPKDSLVVERIGGADAGTEGVRIVLRELAVAVPGPLPSYMNAPGRLGDRIRRRGGEIRRAAVFFLIVSTVVVPHAVIDGELAVSFHESCRKKPSCFLELR